MSFPITAVLELYLTERPDHPEGLQIARNVIENDNAAYENLQSFALEYNPNRPIDDKKSDRVFVLRIPKQSKILSELLHNATICQIPYTLRWFPFEIGATH